MDKEQKERLQQELRFLKESLEADIISKDEYERGKERIERKLKELEEPEKEEEVKEEPEIEIKEIKEKPTKIIGVEEEEKEEIEEKEEEPREEIEKPEEEIKEKEEIEVKEEKKEEPEEEIEIPKKWLYGLVILVIIAILFFSVRSYTKSVKEKPIEEKSIEEFKPVCSSDSDCKQEGMIGVCSNPGTKEAKCEFKEDIKTNLLVINDKNCNLCDTSRTKTIIKEIFPNVKTQEIDYETAEAKKLINKFNIDALPAYIFDSNISNAINFNDFKSALIKKENNYIMTNTASGASYYFKRSLIKNKLDLYVLPETTEKIEDNMQEVLNLFKDKINFTKHILEEEQKEILEKELGINTYPTFLLNNQIKFRGVLPANTIKEKICQVNYFEECSKELPKI